MERGYRNATRTLSVVTALLGVALIATTIARGGGPLATGMVVGVLFLLLGAGRAYLSGRGRSPRGRS